MVATVTHNNHMKVRSELNGPYVVTMGRCQHLPNSFLDEAIRAAELIKEKAGNDPIWISLSGGIDSEFVARVFLQADIPFNAAMTVFKNHLNQYDVSHCRSFCSEVGIKLHEFELDPEEYFATEMVDTAFELRSVSPQFPTHTWLWDQLDGFIVAGHGDPIFKKKDDQWYFQIQEKEDTVYRYALNRNISAATGFYAYTPELLLSFVLEKEVSNMFLSPKCDNIIQVKHLVYEKYFPMMKRREKKTGFEAIDDLDQQYRAELMNLLPFNSRRFMQPIEQFAKDLWPDD